MIWALVAAAAAVVALLAAKSGVLANMGGLLSGSGQGQASSIPAGTVPNTSTGASFGSPLAGSSSAGSLNTFGAALGIGSTGATSAIGIAAETGAISSTVAGIATAGVGAVVGIASILWAQHEQRMHNAQDENQAWNIIYPDWVNTLQQIFASYNAGQMNAQSAIGEVQSLRSLVYQDAQRYKGQPGISWSGGNDSSGVPLGLGNSQTIWQVACNKSCTIGCCLFSGVVGPNTNRAIALLSGQPVALFGSGSQQMTTTNSFTVPAVPINTTYGFNGAPAFTLTANPQPQSVAPNLFGIQL